jgi:hypothetical protein
VDRSARRRRPLDPRPAARGPPPTGRLHQRWDRSSFWKLTSGSGANCARLNLVENETRAEVLAHLTSPLEELRPEDLAWEGEVICAVATKRD